MAGPLTAKPEVPAVARPPDDLNWNTSTFSQNGGACVQWAYDGAASLVWVRHSRAPDGPCLAFAEHEWNAFILGVRDGQG